MILRSLFSTSPPEMRLAHRQYFPALLFFESYLYDTAILTVRGSDRRRHFNLGKEIETREVGTQIYQKFREQ